MTPFRIYAQDQFVQDADLLTIQALYMACEEMENAPGATTLCVGFVMGVGHMMAMNGRTIEWGVRDGVSPHASLFSTSICDPANPGGSPSGFSMIRAFQNWAEDHPERWQDPALWGVIIGLQETWPCQISN
jgi:hypothetical protein